MGIKCTFQHGSSPKVVALARCLQQLQRLLNELAVFDDSSRLRPSAFAFDRWRGHRGSVLPPNRVRPTFRCRGHHLVHPLSGRLRFPACFPPSFEVGRMLGTAHSAPKSRPFVELIQKVGGLPVCAQGARVCGLKETKTEVLKRIRSLPTAHEKSPLTR